MTIKIGSKIQKLDPADPYKLVDGSDVEGFDALKTQSDAAKATLDPLATTDIPAAKQNIANLQKLVDNSVETVAVNDQNQLVITNFKNEKNLVNLPNPGTGPTVDIKPLQAEILKAEQKLAQAGVDVQALKDEYGHIDHQLQALGNVYTYSGTTAPTITTDKTYHSYFISVRSPDVTPVVINMPTPTDGVTDGTMWHLSNNSKVADVTLTPKSGDTINSAVSLTVSPGAYVILVKTGNNWFLVTESTTSAREHPLTADMIGKAVDRGDAPNSGSVKALADGWWHVPVISTKISGRPKGSQGDLTIYKQSLTSGLKSAFSILMAFGQDNGKDPAMWIQYRDGVAGIWTRWEKLDDQGAGDISAITSDITSLKNADTLATQRLNLLQTNIGKIYAPDKSAFDKSANTLIDAATAKLKANLEAAGWGPLTGIAGGDRPLPQGTPKIWAYYGVSFLTSLAQPGIFSSTSGAVSLTRATTNQQRIFVVVPNDANQAEDVTGISVDEALAAKWSSRDVTLDAKSHRVFYSPGAYSEKTNTVQVLFGNQG